MVVQRGVALGGFMGAGKTTVGAILSARLELPFSDTDDVLVARHGAVAEQLADVGEAGFRARERGAVLEACDGTVRVLATGGGVFADAELRRALRRHYWLVTLTAPIEVLASRVQSGAHRPLWDASVAERLASRVVEYADVDLVVDTAGRAPDGVAEEVIAWLEG